MDKKTPRQDVPVRGGIVLREIRSLLVHEAIAIFEATSCDGVRADWPQIDRSRYIIVILEEIGLVLVTIFE